MYIKEICRSSSPIELGLQAGDTIYLKTVAEADQTFALHLWIKKLKEALLCLI